MERTSPDYNDPNFQNKTEDNFLDKYEKGFDKAINAANTVHNIGRKIIYIFMGLFFLLIGGAITIWGIFNYNNRLNEMESFEKTTGTVVSMKEVESPDNSGVTYAPVINYSDAKGQKFIYESKHSSDPPAYVVGEKVNLRYNKNKPEDVFIDTFWGKWSGTLTLSIFPFVIFPVGIWMLISAFRKNKSSAQVSYSSKNSRSYINIG